MPTLAKYKATAPVRRVHRYFSEDFKRKKVRELDQNLTTVSQISKEYQVTDTAVYKWIYKYSAMRKKGVKQVVEAKSDTVKIGYLRDQVREMERMVGQKQIMIDFLEKMIELAEKEYGIDIKKKFSSTPLSGSGSTGKRTKSK
jgi:transposase-like protein